MGFRYFIVHTARPLGLRGWVRNRSDGTVELTAEGERPKLDRLLELAREGPRHASVSSIDTEWGTARGDLEPFGLIY